MLHETITLVLADDHVMVRQSLARVLEATGRIDVVAQASDGNELREVVSQFRPGCVVMDYSMPDHNPVDVIHDFLQRFPKTKIIVLTVHENVHYAVRALNAGAHGYLIKAAAVDELIDAIAAIKDGNIYISKQIAARVWQQLRGKNERSFGVDSLSVRELDVFKLLAEGKTLQQCAKQLGIKVSTVSTYRSRILEKLSIQSTSELVRMAIENNIVQ